MTTFRACETVLLRLQENGWMSTFPGVAALPPSHTRQFFAESQPLPIRSNAGHEALVSALPLLVAVHPHTVALHERTPAWRA
jgi:hypothetical protein